MLSTVWVVVGGWFAGLVCGRRPSPRSHAQSIVYTPNVTAGRSGRAGHNEPLRAETRLQCCERQPAATPEIPKNPHGDVAAGKGNPSPRQRPAGRNPGCPSLKLRALVFLLANMLSVIPTRFFRSIPKSHHFILKLKDIVTIFVSISWYSEKCSQSCAERIDAMQKKAPRLLSWRLHVSLADPWIGLQIINSAPSTPRPAPPATCRSGGSG